jgi:ergothioneine biosynthesis protein EgtB
MVSMPALRSSLSRSESAQPSTLARSTRFFEVRRHSLAICAPLEIEDYVVQSMPDVSPAKWHLAHTSWFFEQFLLRPHLPGYRIFHDRYEYLFNSYYEAVGERHPRPERGLLTRPTVSEIQSYRAHVEQGMRQLFERGADDDETLGSLIDLGINHEQQHQELMLTDLKHVLSRNPLHPVYRARAQVPASKRARPLEFVRFEGGLREIGTDPSAGFCFDNETPRHRVFVEPFELACRLVTNAEYREFIRDRGYARPEFWLADGWATVQEQAWQRPIYWSEDLECEFTLSGLERIDPDAPVSHLSGYEADAYARWAGARLPTEAEWEIAAAEIEPAGNFVESNVLHPLPAPGQGGIEQLYGDAWEWTSSAYAPYPGFKPVAGAIGEYNGKFMCNQLVLRGGSCVTPADHIRATYRNFFYPHSRWQFTGVRLAREV